MPYIGSLRRQLGHRLIERELPGIVVGMSYSYNEFFRDHLPEELVLLSNAQSMKLLEAHYGKPPYDAYGWGMNNFDKTKAGKGFIKDIEASGLVPAMLAWEYISAPDGEYTLVDAEQVSESFLGMRGNATWNLVGDPLRSKRSTRLSTILLDAENEVSLPLEIVRRLRELEFALDEWLPVGNRPMVADAIEEDDRLVTVIVPSWADMDMLDWATHRLFVKDDFPVFAATVAAVKRYGPREAFGTILEACRTKHTSRRWQHRGDPVKTATELGACETVGDFSSKEVPDWVASKPLEKVFSANSLVYPYGSDRRVMTVFTANNTNWAIVLPAPDWWKNDERAWYLYRATTSAREGVFLVED